MFEILTVCTGNVCRSPLAEALLRTRLSVYSPKIHSAGTMGLDESPMTPETVRLAIALGVAQDLTDSHRSRYLTDAELASPDLILAMGREHRRKVVELAERAQIAEEALGVLDVLEAQDRLEECLGVRSSPVVCHVGFVPHSARPPRLAGVLT